MQDDYRRKQMAKEIEADMRRRDKNRMRKYATIGGGGVACVLVVAMVMQMGAGDFLSDLFSGAKKAAAVEQYEKVEYAGNAVDLTQGGLKSNGNEPTAEYYKGNGTKDYGDSAGPSDKTKPSGGGSPQDGQHDGSPDPSGVSTGSEQLSDGQEQGSEQGSGQVDNAQQPSREQQGSSGTGSWGTPQDQPQEKPVQGNAGGTQQSSGEQSGSSTDKPSESSQPGTDSSKPSTGAQQPGSEPESKPEVEQPSKDPEQEKPAQPEPPKKIEGTDLVESNPEGQKEITDVKVAEAGSLYLKSDGKAWYKIKRGDTLTAIALRFDLTVETIARENNIKNVDLILTGNELRLPVSDAVLKSLKR